MLKTNHNLAKDKLHFGWDNSIEPVLHVVPGETVAFDVIDAGNGQVTPASTTADLASFDFNRVNAAFGPVYVEGAQPGDALKVSIVSISTKGWGWTANIPGFGLLAGRFQDEPELYIWRFDPIILTPAKFAPGGRVPLKPFPGIIGVAPAAPGIHGAVTPLSTGGNMDVRDLSVGSELYLPIEVPGGLFSVGDGHAGQGDGEVCGTAIECPMDIVLQFEVVKNANLRFPRFTTPGPVSRHLDGKGYEVTMGVGPDLMESAQNAVSDMVDLISSTHGMRPVEAYLLCSACADLRISEIVDEPHYIVTYYFPKGVFDG